MLGLLHEVRELFLRGIVRIPVRIRFLVVLVKSRLACGKEHETDLLIEVLRRRTDKKFVFDVVHKNIVPANATDAHEVRGHGLQERRRSLLHAVPEFLHPLLLDLPNALSRDTQLVTDLLQRGQLPVLQSKTARQNFPLVGRKIRERALNELVEVFHMLLR